MTYAHTRYGRRWRVLAADGLVQVSCRTARLRAHVFVATNSRAAIAAGVRACRRWIMEHRA